MTTYRFAAKPLAHGAEGYVIDFQEKGVNWGTQNWSPLFDLLKASEVEFDLVHKDDIRVRVRLKGSDGLFSPPKYVSVLFDRPAPAAVPAPVVTATQDGPAVLVEPEPVDGHDIEVRVSDAVAAGPQDALPAVAVPGCCGVVAPLVPDVALQAVHARLVRRSDGFRGPWTEVDVPVADPDDWGAVEDHAAAFPGTISQQGGKDTLVVTSAGLEPLELPRAFHSDNDARAFNAINDRRAFAPHNFPTRCVYEADEVVMAAPVDFRLQCFPGFDVTRAPVRAFSPANNRFPFRRPRRIERLADDPEADRRTCAYLARERRAFNPEEDRDPPGIEQEVAITQDGSTWGDYVSVPHGRDIEAIGYRTRLVVVPPLGPGQGIVIPSWTVRRRRRNRKWEYQVPVDENDGDITYVFDPVPRLMNGASLSAVVTIANSDGSHGRQFVARIVTVSPTQIRFIVDMIVHARVTGFSGGARTVSFGPTFGANPVVTATVEDTGLAAFCGVSAISTTQVTLYQKDHDGTASNEPAHIVAVGPPAISETCIAHVVLAGF